MTPKTTRSFFPQLQTKLMACLQSLKGACAVALLSLAALPAVAQPVVGSTYKDFLPMGGGASVALPQGTWLASHTSTIARTGYSWDVYTLKNKQADAHVPFLVVRQATSAVRWGNTGCQSNSQNHFLVNEHGTRSNDLINKCSRFVAIGQFEQWRNVSTWSNGNAKEWWINVVPGFENSNIPFNSSILLAELTVQQFNGKGLRIEAFILPPKGTSAGKFRDAVKDAEQRPEQTMLDTWASIYIESIQQSYFNKKPQPIMALAYPVSTLASAPVTPSTAELVLASKPPENDELDKERDQRTQELVRQMETSSRPAAQPVKATATATPITPSPSTTTAALRPPVAGPAPMAAPVPTPAPAPAPASAAAALPTKPAPLPLLASPPSAPKTEVAAPAKTPAPTAPPVTMAVDNSAQLRLDQERKALDEEKRKMAQQLEAMTQMLAKLQKENAAAAVAAAAAAAKAKDEAAAQAKAEAAAKTPVTYANRKALVIGNDLYTDVPKLNNAGADAEAMAKSLEAVGYKVYKHLNLSEKKFKQAVRDFRQQLSGGDEVLFFYAGHGVQLGNANYLLPIDVKGDQEDQVKDDAILLQKVLDDLEEKKTKFALAVIDACRDNPFKGKGRAIGGRGLAPTSAATGQMIMFSAGSGQQALDRLGDNDKERNGLFTRIFVKEMVKPGLSVDRVLRNVRNEVVRLARSVGHEQTPALYDQAIGEFYFKQ